MKKIFKTLFEKKQFVRGNINLNTRKGALHKSWGHIFSNHLFGDYVEFGVYKGESFIDSINMYLEFKSWLKSQFTSDEEWRIKVAKNSKLNEEIFFHGLDTFEGMPDNKENSYVFKKNAFFAKEEIVKNKLSILSKSNVKTFLYKGEFAKTKHELHLKLKNRKVSIVNFDCDLEKSTSNALKIIETYIQIGAIFLFDDYNGFNADNRFGQRKAFQTFLKSSNYMFEKFFSYHYSGQAFLCTGDKLLS